MLDPVGSWFCHGRGDGGFGRGGFGDGLGQAGEVFFSGVVEGGGFAGVAGGGGVIPELVGRVGEEEVRLAGLVEAAFFDGEFEVSAGVGDPAGCVEELGERELELTVSGERSHGALKHDEGVGLAAGLLIGVGEDFPVATGVFERAVGEAFFKEVDRGFELPEVEQKSDAIELFFGRVEEAPGLGAFESKEGAKVGDIGFAFVLRGGGEGEVGGDELLPVADVVGIALQEQFEEFGGFGVFAALLMGGEEEDVEIGRRLELENEAFAGGALGLGEQAVVEVVGVERGLLIEERRGKTLAVGRGTGCAGLPAAEVVGGAGEGGALVGEVFGV